MDSTVQRPVREYFFSYELVMEATLPKKPSGCFDQSGLLAALGVEPKREVFSQWFFEKKNCFE